MISVSVHPPPSGRRRLLLRLHLRLIGVVVNIITWLMNKNKLVEERSIFEDRVLSGFDYIQWGGV